MDANEKGDVMGAFDGVRIPYDKGYPTVGFNKSHQYFSNYCFSFFDGFGEPELRKLLAAAEAKGSDTVWVPEQYGRGSKIGLHTWYVRALIKEYFEVKVTSSPISQEQMKKDMK